MSASPTKNAIVVVGGAGAMGRITVRDLVEFAPGELRIVVADRDLAAARALAGQVGRATAAKVDVTDVRATAALLEKEGAFGVIGAVHHKFNLQLMAAALAARAHYCDLGGLFHVTRQQLPLHAAWKKAGLLAIPGMGAAPGVVNVMARAAAEVLDQVREIHIYVGGVDRTVGRPTAGPLATSYTLTTVLDEATQPAAVFTEGKLRFVPPMSGAVDVDFPLPVGRRSPSYTIHSEVATLPASFKAKGVREVSFRIAFDDGLETQLRTVAALGLGDAKPISVGKSKIAPRDVLYALLARQPRPPTWDGVPDEHEVLRVVVRGSTGGRPVERTLDLHAPGIPSWKVGVDADTGCPPSIAMLLLWRGAITARGVVPPERAIPPEPFFAALARRGMTLDSR